MTYVKNAVASLRSLPYDAQQRLTACIRDDIRIVVDYLESVEKARDALAEAHRVIAWLRSGGTLDLRPVAFLDGVTVGAHLASNPPVEWDPLAPDASKPVSS